MGEPMSSWAAVARGEGAIVTVDGPEMECCVGAVGSREVGMERNT